MPHVLLRPHLLGFKNQVLSRQSRARIVNRDLILIALTATIVSAIFWTLHNFLLGIRDHPEFALSVPNNLLSLALLSFFFLLLFSSFVTALGYLFGAQDLPLLLSLPISSFRLYLTRLCETIITSSWMFVLFGAPALLAYTVALDLHITFLLYALVASIPFIIIPTSLSLIAVTLFVNILPAERLKEVLMAGLILCGLSVLLLGDSLPVPLSLEDEQLQEVMLHVSSMDSAHPWWLPSRWAADLLGSFLPGGKTSQGLWMPLALLGSTALCLVALGFIVFDSLFYRGWAMTSQSSRSLRFPQSKIILKLSTMLFPYGQRLWALWSKEMKVFIRDTTQSIQLLILLLLTSIYLYNFRSLRMVSLVNEEALSWWHSILSMANIAMGGCVVAAIATRFVFPSVSMEGRAYHLLRTTPLGIKELLWQKFLIWLMPIGALAVLLIVSGSMAIQVEPATIYLSALIAFALSVGLVGLGIGCGAYFVNFDWHNPAQISASMGTLVYMTLSLALVMASLLPASFIIILSCVPTLSDQLETLHVYLAIFCSYTLTFLINFSVAKKALSVGHNQLRQRED